MIKGQTRAYADNKGGILSAGQAFIAFPNQIHYYTDDCGSGIGMYQRLVLLNEKSNK